MGWASEGFNENVPFFLFRRPYYVVFLKIVDKRAQHINHLYKFAETLGRQ
jgi:hypothetical protein